MSLQHVRTVLICGIALGIGACARIPSASDSRSAPGMTPYPAPMTTATPSPPYGPTVFVVSAPTSLGIMFTATLTLVDIEPGSSAARAGLQAGDQIIAIEDVPVATPPEFDAVVLPLLQTASIQITVRRLGHDQRITLQPAARLPVAQTPTAVPSTLFYR